MALQEQHVAVKFAGGIETKMDSKAVPSAKLLALENGVFTRAISIQKRNGYESLAIAVDGSATDLTSGVGLATRDDELLQFTAARCYSSQSGVAQWSDVGPVLSVDASERSVVRTGTQQTMPDHATLNGVSVYAWEDSAGGVWWTVRDAETGRVYRAPTQANSGGQRPRCVAVGDTLHVYYAVPANNRIDILVINPATPSVSVTPSILVGDLDSTTNAYDACPTTRAGTPALIAWHERATTNIRVGYVDVSGVLGSGVSGHPSVFRETSVFAGTCVAVAYLPAISPALEEIAIARVISTNDVRVTTLVPGDSMTPISVRAHTGMGLTISDDQRITAAYTVDGTSTLWVAIEENAVESTEHFCYVNSVANGSTDSTAIRTIPSVGLASRAFQAGDDADVFTYFVHDATYFNVYLALRLSDQICVGRQVAGGATGVPPRTHLSSAHVADGVTSTCLPQRTRLPSENNDQFGETGLYLLTLDFEAAAHQTAQLGRGLYMAGGCPQHYDGRAWTEQGFHVGPELIGTFVASGGSMTSSTTYLYRVWYEWTDAQGEVHRGPESVGTSVVMGGSDTQVTLTLPTLRVTKKTNVRICVARSLAGDTTRLFRVTSLDPTTAGATNGYVTNVATVNSVAFLDRMSDADLQEQEPVYTTGGVLSNDPTSVGSVVVAANNRLFFSDTADPNVVRYSQELAEGYGVELAPELVVRCPPFGGAVRALSSMDGKIIVFKESAIMVFTGDGPPANGSTAVSGFSAPQLVTSDVGCTEPNSVALIPTGLVFKTAKGIYLLDRSLAVSYVGAPVEAYNDQTVRRATVMPDRSQVLFLTDSGLSLLYDYLFDQWSTFTNHEGQDSAVVDGTYHYLRTDGRVFRETIGQYSDDGLRITLRFETAWIHVWEHLQGLQRFWKLLLLGTWGSPHQLGVQYQTDYEEGWTDPVWLDATGETSSTGWLSGEGVNPVGEQPITGTAYGEGDYGAGDYGGTNPDAYQWRLGLHTDGQSIRFRFEDFERSGLTGATFELTEMTIIAGVKKPDRRPFTAARSS